MGAMYGRFVDMAEKKHACPLCSRGFDPTLETQFTAKVIVRTILLERCIFQATVKI
jgi:hypothetical protein